MRGKGYFVLVALLLAACTSSSTGDSLAPAEQIRAFLAGYLKTSNEALTDPARLQAWRAKFRDSCQICLSGYESTSAIHRNGETVSGGRLIDTTIRIEAAAARSGTVVVTGEIEEAEITDSTGRAVRRYDAIDPVTIIYSIERSSGDWTVTSGQVVQ